jgi:hypothetical protein
VFRNSHSNQCNNNDRPIRISSGPNKGLLESGNGDARGMTMEKKEAPCKPPTMFEEVEAMCKVNPKVGKGLGFRVLKSPPLNKKKSFTL